MGGTLTTVYIRIGAFLPINPSPTILCVCHSGFLIVSEYFPDDWCINKIFNVVQSCNSNRLTKELYCDITVLPDHMSPTSVSSIVGHLLMNKILCEFLFE